MPDGHRDAAQLPDGLRPGGRFAAWTPVAPRFVALDVDGTLVTAEPLPAPRTLRAIADVAAAGVRVGLATGRMAAAADVLLATGAFSGPHVFHNGAVIADGSGTELEVLGLSHADVATALTFAGERDDLALEVYVGRTYLSDRDDPRSAPHAALLEAGPSGRISSVADLDGRTAVKAVAVCFTATAAADVIAAVGRWGLAAGPAASPATPQLRYVNITRSGVDKGSGITAAAERIGVDLSEVVVVGDETNDVPALRAVGTAVAMGDATPEVVAAAHLVAPRFADDGLAVALEALAGRGGDGPAAVQRAPGTW